MNVGAGNARLRATNGRPYSGHHRFTHVLVNDLTTGYGIFMENMLDAA